MKRCCPRCEKAIWVLRPMMPFGMHRPTLLFDHKPTLQEIDRLCWPRIKGDLYKAHRIIRRSKRGSN